ncbi:hypothetical protein Barb7_01702 [Bacteroidales bacterium Barb7]|nr:hypothetical protein Barb7_01702 [Bacteroidales bacterium Barb7]
MPRRDFSVTSAKLGETRHYFIPITYLYDRDEKYVIVLEPLRKKDEYYLFTAYCEEGKDKERGNIMRKYNRRLPDTL